jgi:hypothetical protein
MASLGLVDVVVNLGRLKHNTAGNFGTSAPQIVKRDEAGAITTSTTAILVNCTVQAPQSRS